MQARGVRAAQNGPGTPPLEGGVRGEARAGADRVQNRERYNIPSGVSPYHRGLINTALAQPHGYSLSLEVRLRLAIAGTNDALRSARNRMERRNATAVLNALQTMLEQAVALPGVQNDGIARALIRGEAPRRVRIREPVVEPDPPADEPDDVQANPQLAMMNPVVNSECYICQKDISDCMRRVRANAQTPTQGLVNCVCRWHCGHWVCWGCMMTGGTNARGAYSMERCGLCRAVTGFYAPGDYNARETATGQTGARAIFDDIFVNSEGMHGLIEWTSPTAGDAPVAAPPIVGLVPSGGPDAGDVAPENAAMAAMAGRVDGDNAVGNPIVIADDGVDALVQRTIAAADIGNAIVDRVEGDALGRVEMIASQNGEAGQNMLVALRPILAARYAEPLSSRGVVLSGGETIYPTRFEILHGRSEYIPGGYQAFIVHGNNQHAVLHAQRRAVYKWWYELSLSMPDTTFVDVGGRPDIVETMLGPNRANAPSQWNYMCPLLMPEDHTRRDITQSYVTAHRACRHFFGGGENCPICAPHVYANAVVGENGMRQGRPHVAYVMMHVLYYLKLEDVALMCRHARLVMAAVHVYDTPRGQCAFRRGRDEPYIESEWVTTGDNVQVTVRGNSETYQHGNMRWLIDSDEAPVPGSTQRLTWRCVATVGDFSPSADPMAPCVGMLRIFAFQLTDEAPAPVVEPADQPLAMGDWNGVVERQLNGNTWTYTRVGRTATESGDVHITCRGIMTCYRTRSVTLSYAQWDKIAVAGAAMEPNLAARVIRMRGQLHCSAAEVAFVCSAVDAYHKAELERFAWERVLNARRDADIATMLSGRVPEMPGLRAGLSAGALSLAATYRMSPWVATPIVLGSFGLGRVFHQHISDVRRVGWYGWLHLNQINEAQGTAYALGAAAAGVVAVRCAIDQVVTTVSAIPASAVAKAGELAGRITGAQIVPRDASDDLFRRAGVVGVVLAGANETLRGGARVLIGDSGVDGVAAVVGDGSAIAATIVPQARALVAGAHEVISQYIYPTAAIDYMYLAGSLAMTLMQPPACRVMNQADINRRAGWALWRLALHCVCPDTAQALMIALTMNDSVEGSVRAGVGLGDAMLHVYVEEWLKERMDFAARWLTAWAKRPLQWPRDRDMPKLTWHPGHWAFAGIELGGKIAFIWGVMKTDRVWNTVRSFAPFLMHVAISDLKRNERLLVHTLWNLFTLPVYAQARARFLDTEFCKMIYTLGMGMLPVLRAGNWIAGQYFDSFEATWAPKPQREDAVVVLPPERTSQIPKAKPLMVIGPIPANDCYPVMNSVAWTLDNELRCVQNRVTMEVPQVNQDYFDRVFEPIYDQIMANVFAGVEVDSLEVGDWLKMFKPSRRATLAQALSDLHADAWNIVPYMMRCQRARKEKAYTNLRKSLMLKSEQTARDKDPRGIQQSKPVVLVAGGPWFASLAQVMAEVGDGTRQFRDVHVIFGIGRTKSESFAKFMAHAHAGHKVVMVTGDDLLVCDGRRIYSIDAVRWDAHARRQLLSKGNKLWAKLGADQLVVALCEMGLDREGYTTTGIYYKVDANVASGDCDTIQKNCVSNCPIAVTALLTCINLDGPVVDGQSPFARELHYVGGQIGIKYEFVDEVGVEVGDFLQYHNAEFCSSYPTFDAYRNVCASPKLGRVIARFGLCQPGHRPDVMLRSKALSLRAEAAHSTLLMIWAQRAYDAAGPGPLKDADCEQCVRRRYTELVADAEYSVDIDHERATIAVRYGYTMGELRDEINSVWDEFERTGLIEIRTPGLIAAVLRDN